MSDQGFREQLDKWSAQWVAAFNRGDAKACVTLYTDDFVALYPKMAPVRGRANLEKAFQGPIDSGVKFTSISTEECEADGRIGYAMQTAHSNRGKLAVLLTFRRSDDGTWLACAEAVPGAPAT